ncbi:MAG: hypothetical protein ACI8ZM_001055 [Crocinitomix sp.]|jgi:hypothetical protein
MKNPIPTIVFTLFFSLIGYTQIINFGNETDSFMTGDGIVDSQGNHVFLTSTGERVVISFNNSDYESIWAKQLDFPNSGEVGKIIELASGDYAVYISQGEGSTFGHLLKKNEDGDILWHENVSFAISNMVEIDAGRIAITGQRLDGYLVVIDTNGDLIWSKSISLESPNRITFPYLIVTNDGNLLLTARLFRSSDDFKYQYLAKYDFEGNLIWEKAYESPSSHVIYKYIQGDDDNFYGTGHLSRYGETDGGDLLVVKYNSSGEFIKSRAYSHIYRDNGQDIIQTIDNNFVVIGNSKPQEVCGGNLVVMKIDSELDTLYSKFYGQSTGQGSFYWRLHKKNDMIYTYGGGSLWSSFSGSDVHLIKTDSEFELLCNPYHQEWTITDQSPYTPYSFDS